jgi:hypothetical protein
MAQYRIHVNVKGLREDRLQKFVDRLKWELAPHDKLAAEPPSLANVTVEKVPDPPSSRAERLSEALSAFESAKEEALSVVQELRDELQNWFDGLSGTNLENSQKASALEEAISELENIEGELDGVDAPDGSSVEFPGMY